MNFCSGGMLQKQFFLNERKSHVTVNMKKLRCVTFEAMLGGSAELSLLPSGLCTTAKCI